MPISRRRTAHRHVCVTWSLSGIGANSRQFPATAVSRPFLAVTSLLSQEGQLCPQPQRAVSTSFAGLVALCILAPRPQALRPIAPAFPPPPPSTSLSPPAPSRNKKEKKKEEKKAEGVDLKSEQWLGECFPRSLELPSSGLAVSSEQAVSSQQWLGECFFSSTIIAFVRSGSER